MPYGLPNMSYLGYPVSLPCAGHAGFGLREAQPADAAGVRAHLRRLSAADRRNRFCGHVSDEQLDRHVDGLWAGGRLLVAAHDGPLWPGLFHEAGPVRAMAEIVPWDRDGTADAGAELALTVDGDLRRRGIGTWLVQVAGHLLAARGITRLTAFTLPGNQAFLALARRCGAEARHDRDEVELQFDTHALRRAYLLRRTTDAFRRAG